MKKTILLLLVATAMLTTSCKKTNSDLIIGNWTNTVESYEIRIDGQHGIDAGVITIEFTSESVLYADSRCNCVPTWQHYSLSEDSGKLYLRFEDGTEFLVEELSTDRLVLATVTPNIDLAYRYVFEKMK